MLYPLYTIQVIQPELQQVIKQVIIEKVPRIRITAAVDVIEDETQHMVGPVKKVDTT